MQRVYEENEWGKVSKRIITLCSCGDSDFYEKSVLESESRQLQSKH